MLNLLPGDDVKVDLKIILCFRWCADLMLSEDMLTLVSGAAAEDGSHIELHSGEMLNQLQHIDGVTRSQPDLH